VLRDHEVFRAPHSIATRPLERRPTPDAFRATPLLEFIEVLPLARSHGNEILPGWCAYVYRFGDNPEVEVFSGGINHKTAEAAALWRQGNLFHFGFEEGPAELNGTGRDLLENAIVYIARFTEDRPIARTPSAFVPRYSLPRRASLVEQLEGTGCDLERIRPYLGEEELALSRTLSLAEYAKRFCELAPYFGLDADGKLVLDADLVALGVGSDNPTFFTQALARLESPMLTDEARAGALRALARYAPSGACKEATPRAWSAWYDNNAPYLFFSESGWCRWYVDPLAKARGIASKDLRGPSRATPSRAH
jgi:hypothetical protein